MILQRTPEYFFDTCLYILANSRVLFYNLQRIYYFDVPISYITAKFHALEAPSSVASVHPRQLSPETRRCSVVLLRSQVAAKTALLVTLSPLTLTKVRKMRQ